MTEEQNSVKTCTKTPKKETIPIYRNCCSFDQKSKGCLQKTGVNRLKLHKSSNSLLCKITLQKSFSTTAIRFFQLPTYQNTGEIFHHYLLTIRIHCSTLSKVYNFSLLHEAMYSYKKTEDSTYDPTKLAIHSNMRQQFDLISNFGFFPGRRFPSMTLCTSLMRRTS